MPKLNQIVALANGQRTRTQEAVTAIYKQIQKEELFDGFIRSYEPLLEDEPALPPESKNIQAKWRTCLDTVIKNWTKLLNITATQDYANCEAKGDIKIEGRVLVKDVPVTHLLFLEKHITDVRTFLLHLPVLDPAATWREDPNKACFVAEPLRKIRTRKVPKTLVKYEATAEHPAQTERFDEDVVVGEYKTIYMSGRIPAAEKAQMIDRVDLLLEGIKLAREEANQTAVEDVTFARTLFDFIVKGASPVATTE